MIEKSGINKYWRLLGIEGLIQSAMKKDIFDIQLVYGPGAGQSQGWNRANGGTLCNWRECFLKINTFLLEKSTGSPSGFVPG